MKPTVAIKYVGLLPSILLGEENTKTIIWAAISLLSVMIIFEALQLLWGVDVKLLISWPAVQNPPLFDGKTIAF